MNRLSSFLSGLEDQLVQDVFFFSGKPIVVRKGAQLDRIGTDVITTQDITEIIDEMIDDHQRAALERFGEVDISYSLSTGQRFRVNIFKRLGKLSLVLRYVKDKIPSFVDLRLPQDKLEKIASLKRGLVLICGTAGMGKTTTVGALIEYMNENYYRHIVTIEDPIEFLFSDKKSVITQREIGPDTTNYESALKHVVRQSPDVIYIGELRDKETMEAALHAAETGHLVISTLHTKNAIQTIDRISNFFPQSYRAFLNTQLAAILQVILCQRLIPTKDDKSKRTLAYEIMFNTQTVKDLINDGKFLELAGMIKDRRIEGCITFNECLKELINKGMIDEETALENTDFPTELRIELSGISHIGPR